MIATKEESILYNLSADDYHAADGASASRLNLLHRSPAHLKHGLENPTRPTRAMIIGSAVHSAILEPFLFDVEYGRLPDGDGRSKKVRDAREELLETVPADRILKASEYDTVVAMRDSVLSHPIVSGILSAGHHAEASAFWGDPITDVACKARIDILPNQDTRFGNAIIDLKTTQDASRREFSRNVHLRGYYRQAAHYLNGINYLEGYEGDDDGPGGRDRFLFICVERSAPYCVALYELDEATISAGQAEVRGLMGYWKYCHANDTWPGYTPESGHEHLTIPKIGLPAWAQS